MLFIEYSNIGFRTTKCKPSITNAVGKHTQTSDMIRPWLTNKEVETLV